jgi:hypothetical protein
MIAMMGGAVSISACGFVATSGGAEMPVDGDELESETGTEDDVAAELDEAEPSDPAAHDGFGPGSSQCSFGDCAGDGWTTRAPDGGSSSSRCSFGDCTKDGWSTTHSDGSSSTTRCSFGDCTKDGWSTTHPDGSSSTTRCSFGDCNANGWTTTRPDGTTLECRCNFGNCAQNGADCR